MLNTKIVKEHINGILILVAQVNIHITRLFNNKIFGKALVLTQSIACFGSGSGYRLVTGIFEIEVAIKHQPVQIGFR